MMSDLTLDQAQNEITALQRRLAEYASEVQRLREQGRECYVDADAKSLLNALEECRTERDKLKGGAKEMVEAIQALVDSKVETRQSDSAHYHGSDADEVVVEKREFDALNDALNKARELGLLEDK